MLWSLALLVALPSGMAASAGHGAALAAPVGHVAAPGGDLLAAAIASLGHGAGPAGGTPLACASSSPTAATCAVGAVAALPGGGGEEETETATNGTWASITFGRWGGGFAYDPALGQSILFGGGTGEGFSDTWALQGSHWSRLLVGSTLSAHNYVSMTYDARDNYVLMFGGLRGGPNYLAETWTFQYGVWTKLAPVVSPPARIGGAMAFDAASNAVILFGGYAAGRGENPAQTYFNDTWAFSGGSWTLIATMNGPSPRTNASLVYDPVDHQLVLFGGLSPTGPLGDTWTFHARTWTEQPSGRGIASPAPRDIAAAGWDPSGQQIVLMGGRDEVGVVGDVWTYRGGHWAPGPTGPSPRGGAMMTYDAANDYLVLYGGMAGGAPLSDTWSFSDGVWTQIASSATPAGRAGASMALDPASGVVTLFGGWSGSEYLGDTWAYSGGNWTPLCLTGCGPAPRSGAGLTYVETDAATGAGGLLLFGGTDGSYLNDSWLFNGATWTALPATGGPSARAGMVLVSDGTGPVAFLEGGLGPSGYLSDSWAYNGTTGAWTPVTDVSGSAHGPPFSPTARAYAASAFDPTNDTVLIFGGQNAGGYLGDTWEVTFPDASGDAAWTSPVVSSTTPSPRSNATIAWEQDPPFSDAVLIGGTGGSSTNDSALNDTWAYARGVWTFVPIPIEGPPAGRGGSGMEEEGEMEPAAPVPRTQGSAVYSPQDGYLVHFGGFDRAAIVGDTWVWAVFVAHPIASLTTIDSGVSTRFAETLVGGVAPFTYAWDFGDGGTSTLAAPVHVYNVSTTTELTVTLIESDSAGNVSRHSFPITVYPAMTGTAVAQPAVADVGVPIHFTGSVSGGSGKARMGWSYGDGMRNRAETTDYTYASPGNYSATFYANSTGGTRLAIPVPLRVVPGPSVGVRASVYETDVGFPVEFQALTQNGVGPFAYRWSFGDGATSVGEAMSHSYASAGVYEVVLTANDSQSQAAVGAVSVLVNPLPSIGATVAAPFVTDVGYPVAFEATGAGGTGGLAWGWRFGDGGAGQGPTLAHTFDAPGLYVVEVWANDTLGAGAHTNVNVTVMPLPSITSLVASPATVRLGDAVAVTATVTGGVAPFTYVFGQLPPGCVSSGTDALSCAPDTAGTYAVTLDVADALGAHDSATVTVSVSAPTPAPTVLELAPTYGYLVVALFIGLAALIVVLSYSWTRLERRRR